MIGTWRSLANKVMCATSGCSPPAGAPGLHTAQEHAGGFADAGLDPVDIMDAEGFPNPQDRLHAAPIGGTVRCKEAGKLGFDLLPTRGKPPAYPIQIAGGLILCGKFPVDPHAVEVIRPDQCFVVNGTADQPTDGAVEAAGTG